jgi:hypothetical protein
MKFPLSTPPPWPARHQRAKNNGEQGLRPASNAKPAPKDSPDPVSTLREKRSSLFPKFLLRHYAQEASQTETAHEWSKEEVSLLGKISDGELARRTGLPTHSVWMKRNTMGLPPSRPMYPVRWGAKEIALLGTLPDEEVAKRLDTSRKVVIEKRASLGIPSYARAAKLWHTWTEKEIAMLGTRTDAAVAHRLGIQPICVTAKRHRLRIPGFTKRKASIRPRRSINGWGKDETALLGKMTDMEVSERLGKR